MNVKPLGDRILVKPMQAEEKTKGGILLPDTAKEKPQQGEVVAVGQGKTLETGEVKALEVKAKDKVFKNLKINCPEAGPYKYKKQYNVAFVFLPLNPLKGTFLRI